MDGVKDFKIKALRKLSLVGICGNMTEEEKDMIHVIPISSSFQSSNILHRDPVSNTSDKNHSISERVYKHIESWGQIGKHKGKSRVKLGQISQLAQLALLPTFVQIIILGGQCLSGLNIR